MAFVLSKKTEFGKSSPSRNFPATRPTPLLEPFVNAELRPLPACGRIGRQFLQSHVQVGLQRRGLDVALPAAQRQTTANDASADGGNVHTERARIGRWHNCDAARTQQNLAASERQAAGQQTEVDDA